MIAQKPISGTGYGFFKEYNLKLASYFKEEDRLAEKNECRLYLHGIQRNTTTKRNGRIVWWINLLPVCRIHAL